MRPKRTATVHYKVFLVEDEVATREGIRDNVGWHAMGLELCGEAADGEIALPQIETTQPDILITDIKMPFMDGLQLCKIIREHMPWIKIIIISGHNDFLYAQTAIKLGVTEYLLKPVSGQDLQSVLRKVVAILDQEKSELAYLKRLRSQAEASLSLQREKFLLRLVTGEESAISAIEQSQLLGLNILSPFYQVILLEIKPANSAQPLDFASSQQVEKLVAGILATNPDVLFTKKDIDEFVLILKGENLEQLKQESLFLLELIREEIEEKTGCHMAHGEGMPQQRLGDLHHSFAEALIKVKSARKPFEPDELQQLDHSALRRYLEQGQIQDFDPFYDDFILPLAEIALRSALLKHYVDLDILLSVTQFLSDLGGNASQIIPAAYAGESLDKVAHDLVEMRSRIRDLFALAIAFRENLEHGDRASLIQQAKKYIAARFSDHSLSLAEVAAQVNFSPNHFSAVFSAETGETFRDYLTRKRLDLARNLLSGTRLKCVEVAFQCGYNDPHYFSIIFRKNCGMTPQEYRKSARAK